MRSFLSSLMFRSADSTLENPSTDLVSAITGVADGRSIDGVEMSPKSALRLTAVNSCVRLLAESIGSLPLPVYRRDGRSRERVHDDPRWGLLNDAPNPEMYAMELHENLIGHANLWGKGFSFIRRNNAGQPAEIWPLHPGRTECKRTSQNELYYVTTLESGERIGLMAQDVIEVKAIFGLSPVRTARMALSGAAAAEEYAGHFWTNSARPGGIIETKGRFADDDAFNDFKRRWLAGHQGLSKSQLVGILEDAEWKEVGLAPQLAQFIETRQFSVREIARLFRVPPHMIADLEGTVNRASIEQQAIEFLVYSLRPWLIRSEQAYKMRLFNTPADRAQKLYPEWLVDALLRGDTGSRYEAYAKGIQFGWLSRAEVRQLENLSYRDGLDHFLVPVNMTTAEKLLEAPPPGAQQLPTKRALAYLSLMMRDQDAGDDELGELFGEAARRLAQREQRELPAAGETEDT